MPLVAESTPVFGDLVKREYDKLMTRETVILVGVAETTIPLGQLVVENVDGEFDAYAYVDPGAGVDYVAPDCSVLLSSETFAAGQTKKPAVILARGPAVVSIDQLQFGDGVPDDAKAAVVEVLKGKLIVPRKAV